MTTNEASEDEISFSVKYFNLSGCGSSYLKANFMAEGERDCSKNQLGSWPRDLPSPSRLQTLFTFAPELSLND